MPGAEPAVDVGELDRLINELDASLDGNPRAKELLDKLRDATRRLAVMCGVRVRLSKAWSVIGESFGYEYALTPELIDAIEAHMRKFCPDLESPSSFMELANCIDRMSDPRDKALAFQLVTAMLLRSPPAVPIIQPYDPRCKLKDFQVIPKAAVSTTEPMDVGGGLTWVATAECPTPEGRQRETTFTGFILYLPLDISTPQMKRSGKASYVNVIHLGPVLPIQTTLDLGLEEGEEGEEEESEEGRKAGRTRRALPRRARRGGSGGEEESGEGEDEEEEGTDYFEE